MSTAGQITVGIVTMIVVTLGTDAAGLPAWSAIIGGLAAGSVVGWLSRRADHHTG